MKRYILSLVLACAFLCGQSDRGTVTGRVLDPGGSVIPGAPVVLTDLDKGTQLKAQSTETGSYTIPSVPAGTYSLSVERPGFRSYVQKGIRVEVAQTIRVDVLLQIGATTESITVTADASLLRTDSAEQSTVLSGSKINDLPINFANAGAIRNPMAFARLVPGTNVDPDQAKNVRVNGSPGYTYRIMIDGHDATSAIHPGLMDEQQPSVDAIAEFTVQTSTFSAEFGQVGGGLFNFTAKSGTNSFHGSAYEYLVNEALNSGVPFTDDGSGGHIKARVRQHDFGGTLGGPVSIPKLYEGRNRTFFFFNYERYRRVENAYSGMGTLPTTAYRGGDFSYLLTGKVLNQDYLGRPIPEGGIYDPASSRLQDGRIYRDLFPGNIIPTSRFDPVAVKIQNLMPAIDARYEGKPNNNFERRYKSRMLQAIPSVKLDHSLTDNMRLSVSYSHQSTDKDNGHDGLPDPISARRWETIRSHTARVNYDYTISPSLVNHMGVGFQRYEDPDMTPITDYDAAAELGLKGALRKGFPRLSGLPTNLGPTNYQRYVLDKPTFVENLTWIRGNHTMKFGGDWRQDVYTNRNWNATTGTYVFNTEATGLPAALGQTLGGGGIGNAYASFLLGLAYSGTISSPSDPQYRRHAWAVFAQDNWKVTSRLTLDIGLRYDRQPAAHETHYRTAMFGLTTPNPSAGGLPGAVLYEGYGPGRCNCTFAKTYPYAFGPRLGMAYRLNEKTVIRAGWGITYGTLTGYNWFGGANYSLGFGSNTLWNTSPSYGEPALQLRNGLSYDLNELTAVKLDPGARPSPGQLNAPPPYIDRNGGRPPRLNNWSIGVQHEFTKSLMAEAAYVGNRGVWFRADGLVAYNVLTPERLSSFGLNVNNAADRTLLTSRLDSAAAKARGFTAPYAGFPMSSTVAQSLRPFPQFNGGGSMWAPLGNTWYDSLQVRVTKRYSQGFDLTAAYTWSKSLATVTDQDGSVVAVNDVFNRALQKTLSPEDQPHIFTAGFRYEFPFEKIVPRNRITRAALGGWQLSGMLRYASGTPIATPASRNSLSSVLNRGTRMNRVPGEPLFTKDINGGFDPNKDFVLNPKAWQDAAPGQWGTAASFYSDYRSFRMPSEQLALGKRAKLTEGVTLELRAEFFNVFNRMVMQRGSLESGNPLATERRAADGTPESGFGRVDPASVASPRSGQIIMRITF